MNRNYIANALDQLEGFQRDNNPDRVIAAKLMLSDALTKSKSETSKPQTSGGTRNRRTFRYGTKPRFKRGWRATLKRVIAKNDLSYKDVEELADLRSKGSMSNYLNGKKKPASESLTRICEALEIKVSQVAHID